MKTKYNKTQIMRRIEEITSYHKKEELKRMTKEIGGAVKIEK